MYKQLQCEWMNEWRLESPFSRIDCVVGSKGPLLPSRGQTVTPVITLPSGLNTQMATLPPHTFKIKYTSCKTILRPMAYSYFYSTGYIIQRK